MAHTSPTDAEIQATQSLEGDIGPAEHERSAVVDRDRTRRIAKDALQILLDITLFTPGDKELDAERLFAEFRAATLPALREYRARQKQQFAQAAAKSGLLS